MNPRPRADLQSFTLSKGVTIAYYAMIWMVRSPSRPTTRVAAWRRVRLATSQRARKTVGAWGERFNRCNPQNAATKILRTMTDGKGVIKRKRSLIYPPSVATNVLGETECHNF
jgi:hypothetical protein